MAFANLTTLNHGLGSVTFLGIWKLSNGKIILIHNGSSDIFEMADELTNAVSIHTCGFTPTKGAAIRHVSDGFDRVLISGTQDFAMVAYDGTATATITEHVWTWNGGGSSLLNVVGSSVGGAARNFYAVATLGEANYVVPATPSGVTSINDWTALTTAVQEFEELPGIPIMTNLWNFQAAANIVLGTDFAVFVTGGNDMTLLASMITQAEENLCCHDGATAGKRIIGGTNGNVWTDVGGYDASMTNNIIGVFYSPLTSQYYAYEDLGTSSSVKYSSDGATWNTATISDIQTGTGKNPDRVRFFETDANSYLMFNNSATLYEAPDTRWWKSADGQTWTTMDTTQPGIVMGVYSNALAGPEEIIKIDTANGDIYYSTNEGVSFTGPVSGLISVDDAQRIRFIQETPSGLIAWGKGVEGEDYSVVLTQDAANLHTDPWRNEGWQDPAWWDLATGARVGGEIGIAIVGDDSGFIRAFRRVAAPIEYSFSPHYENIDFGIGFIGYFWNSFGGSYTTTGLLGDSVDFIDIAAGQNAYGGTEAGNTRGMVSLGVGQALASGGQVALAYFEDPATCYPAGWISYLDPELIAVTQGPRNMFVMSQNADVAFAHRAEMRDPVDGGGPDGRQRGWAIAEDKLSDGDGVIITPQSMFADGDVVIVVGTGGQVIVSKDGNAWDWVLTNASLDAGHQVIA